MQTREGHGSENQTSKHPISISSLFLYIHWFKLFPYIVEVFYLWCETGGSFLSHCRQMSLPSTQTHEKTKHCGGQRRCDGCFFCIFYFSLVFKLSTDWKMFCSKGDGWKMCPEPLLSTGKKEWKISASTWVWAFPSLPIVAAADEQPLSQLTAGVNADRTLSHWRQNARC